MTKKFKCQICEQEFDEQNFCNRSDFKKATENQIVVCGFCFAYEGSVPWGVLEEEMNMAEEQADKARRRLAK